MSGDKRWDRPCSLMGCPKPKAAHHHHYVNGHLSTRPCTCPDGGEPGTRNAPSKCRHGQTEAHWQTTLGIATPPLHEHRCPGPKGAAK